MHQELFFKGLKADRAERETQNRREAKCFERVFSLIIQKWENCFLNDVTDVTHSDKWSQVRVDL